MRRKRTDEQYRSEISLDTGSGHSKMLEIRLHSPGVNTAFNTGIYTQNQKVMLRISKKVAKISVKLEIPLIR